MKNRIVRKIDDLNQVEYSFWLSGTILYLNTMLVMSRETTRHKFRVDFSLSYSRINDRQYGMKEEPEIDFDVQVDAVKMAREQIVLRKWKDVR